MWNPEDYAKNSDAQLKWAQGLKKNLDLRKYKSILDVGCGDGKISADFAATSPESKILGIDSSSAMVKYARNKYSQSKYPNLDFRCIDAREFNFKQEFELVFSNATLHWVDDHQAFLQAANSSLKNGGRLMLSCGGAGNAAEVLAVFAELTTSKTWQEYFQDFQNPYFFYGLEDYQTWLADSGFAIARLKLAPKDMTHQGEAGLAGWIRTTWMPFTKCVPTDRRDDFIARFVELYLAYYPQDAEGFAHLSMVRLEVDAQKVIHI